MRTRILAILFFVSLFAAVVWSNSSLSESTSREIKVGVTLDRNRLWTAKSEFLVGAPTDQVWKIVVEDIDHWSEFVPRILFSRVVSREAAQGIVRAKTTSWAEVYRLVKDERLSIQSRVYRTGPEETTLFKVLLMNIPWPVKDRWVLQKELDRYDPATHSYNRRFELVAGNLVVAEGYWRARPHPENPQWSIVYYENSYDPGFQVPEFIFKPIVRSDTRKILEAVRTRAENY